MGLLFPRPHKTMCTARALLITLFATIALVSCFSEDTIVDETELLQKPDQPTTITGGKKPIPGTTTATDGPTDQHDDGPRIPAGGCPACQILCSDGVCANECSRTTWSYRSKRTGGLKMNFSPDMHANPLPPKVAGTVADYRHLKENFARSEQADKVREIEKAEQSAALGFGSHQLSLEGHAQHMQAWEQRVERKMNNAAELAALFKKETLEHNKTEKNVDLAHIKVKEQRKRVKEAEATLKAEKRALRKAKEYMTEMVRFEQHARYKAEEAGNRYTKAKAAAIGEDNALQEEKHETKMKQEYEKVALKAVARKAKLDEEKVQAEQRAALQ